jgi:hypothetical protein
MRKVLRRLRTISAVDNNGSGGMPVQTNIARRLVRR